MAARIGLASLESLALDAGDMQTARAVDRALAAFMDGRVAIQTFLTTPDDMGVYQGVDRVAAAADQLRPLGKPTAKAVAHIET